jgi:alpha-ribazole phosphatase
MTMKTRWWWIRHAPVVNPEGKLYGQLDLDVDLSDGKKLEALAKILPDNAVWVTTSLRRARETANRLSAITTTARSIDEHDNLREQSFGDWEGSCWQDIPAAVSEAFWKDPAKNRVPNGESFADVVTRVTETVEQLNTHHTGRDIVAVTHTGSIRAAITHALGGDARAGLSFQLAPLSLTRIDAIHQDDNVWWRISGVNLFGDHE